MNCTLNIEDYMNRIATSIDDLEYNIKDNKIYYKSGITDDYMTKKEWLDKVKEHMNNHFAKKIPKLGYSDDVFKVITKTIDNKFIPYIEYSPNNNSKKIIEEYVNDFYEPKIDKTESDVKKEIGLYNEVNESNIPLILSRLKKYNQSSGTKHRIEFKQIGESQRYKSNLILNFNNIEDVKKEREIEQARVVQREDAKRAGVEYDDDYLKDLEDRIIFTEKDGQIRMNFTNLTDLIKNNDIRVLDLKAEDNKISNFTKADIQGLENYADVIPDISREQALKELANIENIDDPGVFYVTSYLAQVFIDRLVDKDGLMFYEFRTPKETGGITPLIRSKLKDVRIVITKDNLKSGVPFYQYNNAIVIGLKQLNNYIVQGWSLEQLETIVRTVADEEAIHLITEEVTTQEDIDKIYNELSESDIKEIKDIYGSDSLSKEGVVYEYLRMVVQNKIFGTTTEIEVAKITQTVMDVLRKLIKRLIGFLTTRAPGDFTQTIINDIYNFAKGNISEELASKIENKVYKGVVAEANINRVKEGVPELFEQNLELATIGTQEQYSQYLESLNKPNTNPVLQSNQQEQIKKFVELQERLNNKEFIEGAKNAYESSKGLQEWGTQEQYNDYIARVSLGIVKNPSSGGYNYTSKVKDIVYHVTSKLAKENIITDGFNEPDEENLDITEDSLLWFSKNKNYYVDDKKILELGVVQAILNIKHPTISDHQMFLDYGDLSGIRSYELPGDGLITKETPDIGQVKEDLDAFEEFIQTGKFPDWYSPNNQSDLIFAAIPNKLQAHILGSKQDIKGFKEFVNKQDINQDLQNLNLTTPVLESLYENSSKSKDFITFVKDLKKMIAIWQNSGRTNEEILEMIKCL